MISLNLFIDLCATNARDTWYKKVLAGVLGTQGEIWWRMQRRKKGRVSRGPS